MEQAADGGAGAAVSGGGVAASSGAVAAAPASTTPAATSALAQGASEAAALAGGHWLPEKFHVKDESGNLKLEDSARKVVESYKALETRLRTGDVPPDNEEGYKVEKLPEGVPTWDEIKADPAMKGFIKGAHAKGITNAQLEYVIGEHYRSAKDLVAGAAELDAQAANQELRKVWTDETAFKANLGHSYRATMAAAAKAGIAPDEVHAKLGSNPLFIRLMAALGPEFKEGSVPAVGGAGSGGMSLEELERHPAYSDPKHVDHERISKLIRSAYEARFGTNKPL